MPIDSVKGGQAPVLQDYDTIVNNLGGDVNALVGALILKCGQDQRHGADEAKRLEELRIAFDQAEEIAAIHEQADLIRKGGAITMFNSAVEGGADVAGALSGDGGLIKGSAKIVTAVGQGVAADNAADIELVKAHQKELANAVDTALRRLKDVKDLSDDARELIRNAIEFLRNAQQTGASTGLGAVNGIRA